MGSIIGIPTTRVSDLFIRQRLMNQMQGDQLELFQVQTQLSTGHVIQAPSEDADAALRIMSLQRLLERKDQVQTNLATNQSYLAATDSTLMSIYSTVAEVKGIAVSAVGDTADETQRLAAVQQIQQTLRQPLCLCVGVALLHSNENEQPLINRADNLAVDLNLRMSYSL